MTVPQYLTIAKCFCWPYCDVCLGVKLALQKLWELFTNWHIKKIPEIRPLEVTLHEYHSFDPGKFHWYEENLAYEWTHYPKEEGVYETKSKSLLQAAASRFLELNRCCLRWVAFHTLFEHMININSVTVASCCPPFCGLFPLLDNRSTCRLRKICISKDTVLAANLPVAHHLTNALFSIQVKIPSSNTLKCWSRHS